MKNGGGGGGALVERGKQWDNKMGRMIRSDGTKGLGVIWKGCKLQQ